MGRFAAILLLAFASQTPAQDVALQIKGDVEIVKVTRLVPLVEDREIIKKLPFDVLAPKDADGYWWTVPAGVTANDKGDALEITAAPNGELTIKIKVQTITFDIDFEKKTVKKKTTFTFGSRTLNIGAIPPVPPPPPPPPPPPDTPLYKSLKSAYDADLDLDKSAKILKFADILDGAAPAAKAGGRVKTAAERRRSKTPTRSPWQSSATFRCPTSSRRRGRKSS
jgi:hypothetical protein